MAKTVLVLGGGIVGCCAAHLLDQKGFKVTLLEKDGVLGGGVRTHFYGGHPFTYGPRHFLDRTKDGKCFNYINSVIPMRRIQEHEFLTYVVRDEKFYHYPIHMDEIPLMPDAETIKSELAECKGIKEEPKNFEEYWKKSIGNTLYSKFVDSYSKKMWQVESNTQIDEFNWSPKGVALKSGKDKACWTEAISAYPEGKNGYDEYFNIVTKNVDVRLSSAAEDYDLEKRRVKIGGEWTSSFDIIVSTISPETTMKNAFGPLRWIGRQFLQIVLPMEHCFPPDVYFLYYANEEPFTRIVEYKRLYQYKSPTTLLGLEIPCPQEQGGRFGKLYPYPIKAEQAKAQKYLDAMPKNVFSIGRHGSYQYRLDISPSFEQVFDLMDKL